MLTRIGGYDRCVTEFVRVSDQAVPAKVFHRLCPELRLGGRTESGTPVFPQLLGGDPVLMARSARTAVNQGAPGIDLNFGCPAKTVNRRDGGSVLLREPHRVRDVVCAVRDKIDADIPVCAKIRLGFDHSELLPDIVEAVHLAGATELAIHARTRNDGYKPPAYWNRLSLLPRYPDMDIIVNGEIWGVDDARKALSSSGCRHLMLGRGALARPDLPRIIRAELDPTENGMWTPLSWQDIAMLVEEFFHHRDSSNSRYAGNRTKQWLGYLMKQYPEAGYLFRHIKKLHDHHSIATRIQSYRQRSASVVDRIGNQNMVPAEVINYGHRRDDNSLPGNQVLGAY